MQKRYLFTPGPTPVPPEVLAAERRADGPPPRAPTSARSTSARSQRLQEVFRTDGQVLLFAASGTGAMESAVANLTRAGRQGRGRRRRRVRRALGEDLRAPRPRRRSASTTSGARCPTRRRSRSAVARGAAPAIVFCTQSETSTGVVADVQAIKAAVGDAIARGRRRLLARRRARSRPTPGASTSSSPARRRR